MVHVSRSWRLTAWFIYLAIAFTLTHLPPRDLHNLPDYLADYILHGTGYAILGILSVWVVLTNRRSLTPRLFLVVFLAILTYAAIDERTQPWVGRACELSDWLADAAGSLIGMSIAAGLNRVISAQRASP